MSRPVSPLEEGSASFKKSSASTTSTSEGGPRARVPNSVKMNSSTNTGEQNRSTAGPTNARGKDEHVRPQAYQTADESLATANAMNDKGKGKATALNTSDDSAHPRVRWDPAVSETATSHAPRKRLQKRSTPQLSQGETSPQQSKSRVRDSTTPAASGNVGKDPRKSYAAPIPADQHISKQKGRRDEIARHAKDHLKDDIRLDNFPALVLLKDNEEAYEQWMAMAREAASKTGSED